MAFIKQVIETQRRGGVVIEIADADTFLVNAEWIERYLLANAVGFEEYRAKTTLEARAGAALKILVPDCGAEFEQASPVLSTPALPD